MELTNVSRLTDSALIFELTHLAGTERRATVSLIVRLAEFDARRLYEGAGFSSTFKYCMEVLRLSEDAAFNRIETARLARRYPVVLDMLVSGELSPTTARMLARRLTPDNCNDVLKAASGKSKQEVEKLLAGLFPQPDVAPLVRRLPTEATTAAGISRAIRAVPEVMPPAAERPLPAAKSHPAPSMHPLSEDRYVIRFTATGEMREKLQLALDLLGHAIPSGDLSSVFDRALTLLVEHLRRNRFGAVKRPRGARGQTKNSRHVPAAVRREVVRREGGRCAFVSPEGRRCGERRFLQFHHVHPYWAGGKATEENIQLRCGPHNRHEAKVFFDSMFDGAHSLGGSPIASARLNPFQNG